MLEHKIARLKDSHQIKKLMNLSISKLLGDLLDEAELEAANESMGLDSQLINDKSYFLVFQNDKLVGSGGYSARKTLFGGNHTPNRSDDLLIPGTDAAKIRAMYTHPEHTRQGIGSYVLKLAEDESVRLGFDKFELMATVSGILLYEKRGYEIEQEVEYISQIGNKVPMYKMIKKVND